MQSTKVDEVFDYFTELFGENPKCELNYSSDIELLVSIILSAQCTDKRVNIVTKELFKKYKTVVDFANAEQSNLEREIYSTGFYHNKAKNIISMARSIIENHNGKVPCCMENLINLAGIGRKTANVFLSEYCKVPALAVDTHVIRVSNRLGFSKTLNPDHIERDLCKLFDRENWSKYHYYMVLFGRYHCFARNPKCNTCKIKKNCKYFAKN